MKKAVMRHPFNIDYSRSLKDNMQAALYDAIVISDADCTYPIEEIPTLLSWAN